MLEVGCGNCHFLMALSILRPDVSYLGLDIENVDSRAKQKIKNFRFIHGQFETSYIKPNSVDLIYFSNLIEHVENPITFLKKCRVSLNEKGRIYGVTPNHLSLDRFIFGKYWAGYHYPRHTYIYNHVNLKMLFEKTGFYNHNISGSYSFWYLSFANKLLKLPGLKKRGIFFAIITGMFYPLDLFINIFRPHGSLSFTAEANEY